MILLARRQEAGRSRCGDSLGRSDPSGKMHAMERSHGAGNKAPEIVRRLAPNPLIASEIKATTEKDHHDSASKQSITT
jgi:hypothetical protein